MKFLIVGLGNVGSEYENTRHNIGFDVLDQLATKHNAEFEIDRHASHAEFRHKGRSFHLIKPTTFMNLSGKAVVYWMDKLKIPVDHILIVVDDLALPLGTTRLKGKGSDAGHNGLKNINLLLNSTKYPRLKCGIGNEFPKGRQVDFVLGKWDKKEENEIPFLLDKACDIIVSFAAIGITRTMNQFN